MKEQTKRGWIRTGSIIMLVSTLFFPMIYAKFLMGGHVVAGSFTWSELAAVGESSFFLVLICAIGLLVSSWVTNAALAKTIQLILQTGLVGGTLWTLFDIVWSGQVAENLGSGADVHFEWGFWIICLGFIIALIGTLVPEEAPGK